MKMGCFVSTQHLPVWFYKSFLLYVALLHHVFLVLLSSWFIVIEKNPVCKIILSTSTTWYDFPHYRTRSNLLLFSQSAFNYNNFFIYVRVATATNYLLMLRNIFLKKFFYRKTFWSRFSEKKKLFVAKLLCMHIIIFVDAALITFYI